MIATNLQRFYNDTSTKTDVKDFLILCLREKAIDLAFAGKGTDHIMLAKEVIEEAWNTLEKLYGQKENKEEVNQAR